MSSSPTIQSYNVGFSVSGDMLRLHLNETPYGSPAGSRAAASTELAERLGVYPDSDCTAVRQRIADHYGLPVEQVAVGNGTDELILLTALTFLGPERTALVTETSFPGYLQAAAVVGARTSSVPLDDYRVAAASVATAMADGIDVTYICNPVNPTGTALDRDGVARIVAAAESSGSVVVFDEAYMDFAGPAYEHAMDAARAGRPVIVCRTFSKAWGLAALRVGYAIGPADLIGRLWRVRQSLPFNVNRLAQQAAIAALDEPAFVAGVRERTAKARELLYHGLETLGLQYVPSVTNFVLVRTGGDSGAIAHRLATEHKVLVRDLTLFGIPGALRVTVGTPEQVDRFCTALAAVLPDNAPPLVREHWNAPVPTLGPLDAPTMFNGYVGAHVVYALRELGAWDRLAEGPVPVAALAGHAEADPGKVRALLRTAALLGHVQLRADILHEDLVTLTDTGRDLLRHKGFFTWGVGGYGELMRGLADLAVGAYPFRRDEGRVAAGAGEVGKELMLPVEAAVISGLDYTSVADIGCGDGSRLIRLCQHGSSGPGRRGLGIDISEAACALAAKKVADAGLADHLEIICQNPFAGEHPPVFPGIDLASSFLMLHDLFATYPDGVSVVAALRRAFPDARYFLLADTAAQPWSRHTGPLPPFSLEFELAHAFMGVPIPTKEVYERAFLDGGLTIERCEPFGAPSTWIYLLRVK